MKNEVLLAILSKLVDEKLGEIPESQRGPRGRDGARGPKGLDGESFVWEEQEEKIRGLVNEAALTFEDLTPEQVSLLRGQAGRDGRDGKDGKSFIFEEYETQISALILERVVHMSDDLKLKFEDLSNEERESLRGPRGREGRDGKNFVFDEHKEFFEGLKPKFSDFTQEERDSLVLKFSNLTQEEREGLKLKFSDLSYEERSELRGARGKPGQRGVAGPQGEQGAIGERGPQGARGAPGPIGIRGATGPMGRDGRDGNDAPYITDIETRSDKESFWFVFSLSDGSEIESNKTDMPKGSSSVFYGAGLGGGGSGGGSGGDGKSAYEIAVEEGFVGTVDQWLASLVGPEGPEGPQGIQGPPGLSGDGDSGLLHTVSCEADVYVGSAIILRKENPVANNMAEWTTLQGVLVINYISYYDTLAVLGMADAMEDSNIVGIVESKNSDTECVYRIGGVSAANYIGLDVQDEYYLSDIVPGGIVPSALMPTTPGAILLKIGQPMDRNHLIFSRGERTILDSMDGETA